MMCLPLFCGRIHHPFCPHWDVQKRDTRKNISWLSCMKASFYILYLHNCCCTATTVRPSSHLDLGSNHERKLVHFPYSFLDNYTESSLTSISPVCTGFQHSFWGSIWTNLLTFEDALKYDSIIRLQTHELLYVLLLVCIKWLFIVSLHFELMVNSHLFVGCNNETRAPSTCSFVYGCCY